MRAMPYTRREIHRLCGETGADPRTVTRWLRGEPVTAIAAYGLEEAAKKLGIPLPASTRDDTRKVGAA
jgi:hypothetical protein